MSSAATTTTTTTIIINYEYKVIFKDEWITF
jgi:hypothetical protein